MGFIDTMRSQGHVVESICRVLREQGCQIAARTYRAWKHAGRAVAARTVTDSQVIDAVRDIAWTTKVDSDGVHVRKLSPEGLYGRRKMTAYLRRVSMPEASAGAVDRAMRTLGLSGSGVTRAFGPRSRPRTALGPATCWTATSPPPRPIVSGSPTSPMSGRGPASPTSRSSSTSTPNGSWPGTPPRPSRPTS